MMDRKITDYEIREDTDDEGNAVFDVYVHYEGDSEFIEEFKSAKDARTFVAALKKNSEDAERFYLQYIGNISGNKPDYTDSEAGYIVAWTLAEILKEINRDRSAGWTDYDKTDWQEGLKEWTEYRPFSFRSHKRYVVRANVHEANLNGGVDYRIYADECGTFTEWHSNRGVDPIDRTAALVKADRFTLERALQMAADMNASDFAKRNGYTFRVYPAKEYNTPRE